MKKTISYLLGLCSISLLFAAGTTSTKDITHSETTIGSNITSNPYSIDKQYQKAEEIKKDNNFYNLKDANKVAIAGPKKAKYYSLIDIYNLAAQHNAQYQAARSTFAANTETVPSALGALLPQINFSYNLKRDISSSSEGQVANTTNDIEFSGSQTLFNWSQWKTLTQANYLQKSYAMIYAKAEQTLILNTINTYFELLRAQQTLTFQLANEAWSKGLYKTEKLEYKTGTVSYADLKTTEAQYHQATADRIDAQNSLITAKANMAKLIGKRIDAILYISKASKFEPPKPNNIKYWLDTSKKYNLDIAQKEFEYQAATEGVGIQWGNFFPNANLSGNIQISTDNGNNSQAKEIAGNVSWNLLNGGSDYAALKKASYDNQAANYSLLQVERETYASTVQSFQNVTLDSQRIKAYKKSVVAGLASVEAILEGYRAGTQTIIDLLNRQTVLVQSQLSFSNAIFNYIEQYAQLKQVQGGLTYKDIEYINTILGKKNMIDEIATR